MLNNSEFGTKKYFEKLYASSNEPWGISYRVSQQHRYRICNDLLTKYSSSYQNTLDIGCSQGQFTELLKNISKKITAIDIDETAIQRAKQKYIENENITFEIGDILSLKYNDNSFDLVTALEVIYYLQDQDQAIALNEIKRVLKPEGLLLVSGTINTPGHIYNPKYFKLEEFKSLVEKYFKIKDIFFGYYRVYSFFEKKIIGLNEKTKKPSIKKVCRSILSSNVLLDISIFLTKIFFGKTRGRKKMFILAEKQ